MGLSPKDINGAFSEATLLSKIRHPHIVGYLDAWVENCHLYIVMEYCSGGDLSAKVQTGRMAEPELWRCARDIACGLEFLHSKRVMHRYAPSAKSTPAVESAPPNLGHVCCLLAFADGTLHRSGISSQAMSS